jgi:hypothetical protein
MGRTRKTLPVAALFALLAACGDSPGGAAAVPAEAGSRASAEDATAGPVLASAAVGREDASLDAEPGALVGRVVYAGRAPARKALQFPLAGAVCPVPTEPTDRFARDLLVDGSDGIADVIVSVEVDGWAPPEPVRATFDFRDHRLEPHLLLVPSGSAVGFRNGDGCLHGLRVPIGGRPRELTIPTRREEWLVFEDAGAFSVDDPRHPWIQAWVKVTERRFATLTGPDGAFELRGLPAGRHEVEIEHETLGLVVRTVLVPAGGTCEAEFTLPD